MPRQEHLAMRHLPLQKIDGVSCTISSDSALRNKAAPDSRLPGFLAHKLTFISYSRCPAELPGVRLCRKCNYPGERSLKRPLPNCRSQLIDASEQLMDRNHEAIPLCPLKTVKGRSLFASHRLPLERWIRQLFGLMVG